jgi:hypothetical protein
MRRKRSRFGAVLCVSGGGVGGLARRARRPRIAFLKKGGGAAKKQLHGLRRCLDPVSPDMGPLSTFFSITGLSARVVVVGGWGAVPSRAVLGSWLECLFW